MGSAFDVDAEPKLPLEIFQLIIKDVADMMFAAQISELRFVPEPNGDHNNQPEQHRLCLEEWLDTLLSLSVTSKSFNILSQPYLMRTIKISSYHTVAAGFIWRPLFQWFPASFEMLLEDASGGPAPKVLDRVNGLVYQHYGWENDLDFTLDQATSHPELHLLGLPSLQVLGIHLPVGAKYPGRVIFDYSMDTRQHFGFWTLLETYVFGRPKGFLESSPPESNGTLAAIYNDWSMPTVTPLRSLTHLSLSYIENLPLLHLLTSATLTSLQLYYCTAAHETNGVSLFSESRDNESGFRDIINLVPSSSPPESLGLQAPAKPGFRLKSWKAIGIDDVIPSLLQYCIMLQDLDVTLVNSDGMPGANESEAFPVTILVKESTSLTMVPLPPPIPFQNVRKLRCGGRVDWAYLCALAENVGHGAKLLPNLRELTLDRQFAEIDDNDAKQDSPGLEVVLIGHVNELEVLRIIRGHPLALNLSQALLASSNSLKELYIGWEIESPLHLPQNICESTLCDALDVIRLGANRIETLEVVLDFHDISSGCESLFSAVEDGDSATHGVEDGDNSVSHWAHWTRLSTLLSFNPDINFPFLQWVYLNITFHTVLEEEDCPPFAEGEDTDIEVARNFQRRLGPLLDMDAGAGVPNIGGMNVKLKLTVVTENQLYEIRTNMFEVTGSSIGCSKSIKTSI